MVPLPGDLPLVALFFALILGKRTIARYGSSWASTKETSFMHSFTKGLMRHLGRRQKHIMLVTGNGNKAPSKGLYWLFSTALSAKLVKDTVPNLSDSLQKPVKLVYIGRLSSEKGVLYFPYILQNLINGLQKLDGVSVELHLIGDGPLRSQMEQEFDNIGIRENIIFHGLLNQHELFHRLNQMDLCIQPSKTEGFSKAWLDALLCGVPVLTSNVGAAEFVVGSGENHRGWLVNPNDPDAVVQKLLQIIQNDQSWSELRGRCVAFASSRTLESWSYRIKEICEERWKLKLC